MKEIEKINNFNDNDLLERRFILNLLDEYEDIVTDLGTQAKKFYDMKYQMSNGGNLSARIPNTNYMIVKGTDVDFSCVNKQTLVVTDFNGNVIEGEIKPSKEALLHGAIYDKLPHVKAIMHCHSPWTIAWGALHEQLEFSTYHSDLKLKGYCPVFDTNSYAVSKEYIEKILEELEKFPEMNSFILRKHGQVTFGTNIKSAALLAELVEETAQVALLAKL